MVALHGGMLVAAPLERAAPAPPPALRALGLMASGRDALRIWTCARSATAGRPA